MPGIIIHWPNTLATIPLPWYLCEGSAGRPNLPGKYLKGSEVGVDPGATSGESDDHTHTTVAHTHTQDSHTHTGTTGTGVGHNDERYAYPPGEFWDADIEAHSQVCPSVSATETNQATTITTDVANGEPAYYKVLFIMQDRALDLTGANLMQMLL